MQAWTTHAGCQHAAQDCNAQDHKIQGIDPISSYKQTIKKGSHTIASPLCIWIWMRFRQAYPSGSSIHLYDKSFRIFVNAFLKLFTKRLHTGNIVSQFSGIDRLQHSKTSIKRTAMTKHSGPFLDKSRIYDYSIQILD